MKKLANAANVWMVANEAIISPVTRVHMNMNEKVKFKAADDISIAFQTSAKYSSPAD